MAANRADDLCMCLRAQSGEQGVVCTVLADGSGVLLDVQGGRVMSMNPLAVFIWGAVVEEHCALGDIIAQIADHYGLKRSDAEADVMAFLNSAAACLDCQAD